MPCSPSPNFTPDPKLPDPRNESIQTWVGDRLWQREEARVSVFDSSVQGGDAVWEGLRIYDGKIFQLDAHLDRLFASAKALCFANVPSREFVKSAIFQTLEANGMRDQSHIRLTLTRGKKVTSGMSPVNNQYGCTLIVPRRVESPCLRQRERDSPDHFRDPAQQPPVSRLEDSSQQSSQQHSSPKSQSDLAGVDDAVMLDDRGFLAETNATNLFLIRSEKSSHPLCPRLPARHHPENRDGCLRRKRDPDRGARPVLSPNFTLPTKLSLPAQWESSAPFSKLTDARSGKEAAAR